MNSFSESHIFREVRNVLNDEDARRLASLLSRNALRDVKEANEASDLITAYRVAASRTKDADFASRFADELDDHAQLISTPTEDSPRGERKARSVGASG